MGKIVVAEESHLEHLKNVSNCTGYTPGLILGQATDSKDYVVHLPVSLVTSGDEINGADKLPSEEAITTSTTFEKLTDIDENLLAEHAKTVTRMLPGGVWVLGFYIVGPGDIFNEKNSIIKIRAIANAINNCDKGNKFICAKSPSSQKLVLHFSSLSKKYVCKGLEVDNMSSAFIPIDWKFQQRPLPWLEARATLNMYWAPIYLSVASGGKKATLKSTLKESLTVFKDYVEGLQCLVNEKNVDPSTALNKIEKISIKSEDGSEEGSEEDSDGRESQDEVFYKIEFIEKCEKGGEGDSESGPTEGKCQVELVECEDWVRPRGYIPARVYLHEKATLQQAANALKEDFLRSWASRLEMHWQTYEEGVNKKKVSRHQPPRRILYKIPDSNFTFSEYLFQGETETDAVASIEDNLGLSGGEVLPVEPDHVQLDDNTTADTPDSKSSVIDLLTSRSPLLLQGLLSAIVVLLAIVLYFYF